MLRHYHRIIKQLLNQLLTPNCPRNYLQKSQFVSVLTQFMMCGNRASRTVYTDVILYQRIWHDHDNRKTVVVLAAVIGAWSVGGSVFSWVVVGGVDGWCNIVVFSAVNGTYTIRHISIRCISIRCGNIRCSSIHCINVRHSVLAPRSGLVEVIWVSASSHKRSYVQYIGMYQLTFGKGSLQQRLNSGRTAVRTATERRLNVVQRAS